MLQRINLLVHRLQHHGQLSGVDLCFFTSLVYLGRHRRATRHDPSHLKVFKAPSLWSLLIAGNCFEKAEFTWHYIFFFFVGSFLLSL